MSRKTLNLWTLKLWSGFGNLGSFLVVNLEFLSFDSWLLELHCIVFFQAFLCKCKSSKLTFFFQMKAEISTWATVIFARKSWVGNSAASWEWRTEPHRDLLSSLFMQSDENGSLFIEMRKLSVLTREGFFPPPRFDQNLCAMSPFDG